MNQAIERAKIRIIVVDDSPFVRRAVIKMFEGSADVQVIDVASDGEMAIRLIKKWRPDVVTLDVKMPVMDGLEALHVIMTECPTPVVMLSSLTERGGENTLRALELGAVDFIDKSSAGGPMDIAAIASELASKILTAAHVDVQKLQNRSMPVAKRRLPPPKSLAKKYGTEMVLIGTSTGGPPALQTILTEIPEEFPCPILVVQHMPVGFTASLAERLNRLSMIEVKEAVDGEEIVGGRAYLAPAGWHMKIRRCSGQLFIRLDLVPENALHKPSVDVLFESAAAACGKSCVAVVLTGMGRDGSCGAQALKNAGSRIVVESEETCRVYGMPKAVTQSVKVDASVPLYEVCETILKMI